MKSSSAEKSERGRCIWCHRRNGELKSITVTVWNRFATRLEEQTLMVHPEHEADLRAFTDRFRRYGRLFLILIAALTLAMVATSFALLLLGLSEIAGGVLIGVLMALMGALTIALPFCTPETVKMMGVKSAVRLTRVLGIVTISIAAVITAMIALT